MEKHPQQSLVVAQMRLTPFFFFFFFCRARVYICKREQWIRTINGMILFLSGVVLSFHLLYFHKCMYVCIRNWELLFYFIHLTINKHLYHVSLAVVAAHFTVRWPDWFIRIESSAILRSKTNIWTWHFMFFRTFVAI